MKRATVLALIVAFGALGCTGDDDTVDLTTTTTRAATTASTTMGTSTSLADAEEPVSTTTIPGEPVTEFDAVVTNAAEGGDRLWVLIPPGNYRPVDLENFVLDFLEAREEPLLELHVYDDRPALEAGRVDAADRTAAEQALVDGHYLISVTEGTRVEFQGPYAGQAGFTYGS